MGLQVNLALPFDDDSRTGFELEFLAPRGKSRRDLALALATAFAGEVERGFKYHSEGPFRDGRPICDLTPAWRVVCSGEVLFTLVDDVTITADLDKEAATPSGQFRVILDDLRISLWAEQRCWGPDTEDPQALLRVILETFDATLNNAGTAGARDARHRIISDPWGHGLGVVALYEGERERPCEVVTRPLSRHERRGVIARLLEVIDAEDFGVPHEAALHLHVDNGPWLSTARLSQLMRDTQAARPLLHEMLEPNPACKRLGPFTKKVMDVVDSGADLAFRDLCSAISKAGASKFVDVNILGVIRERPRHPTVEVRCLPVDVSEREMFARIDAVENFMREVALTADAN